jgi:hypothetical protein
VREYPEGDLNAKVNGICRSPPRESGGCNDGWMAQLEARLQPILAPLIAGENAELAMADQFAIARWALKTALIFDLFIPRSETTGLPSGFTATHPPIPSAVYRAFRSTEIQAAGRRNLGTWPYIVAAGAFDGRVLIGGNRGTTDRVFRVRRENDPDGQVVRAHYSSTVLVLGRLLLRVVGPLDGGHLMPAPIRGQRHPFLVRLHPNEGDPIPWPGDLTNLDDRGLELLAASSDF